MSFVIHVAMSAYDVCSCQPLSECGELLLHPCGEKAKVTRVEVSNLSTDPELLVKTFVDVILEFCILSCLFNKLSS